MASTQASANSPTCRFRKTTCANCRSTSCARIAPLVLEAKEGLALLNGTQAMTSVGGLALLAAERLANVADITGALSLEALKGTPVAFDPRIHKARPHPGQIESARRLTELI